MRLTVITRLLAAAAVTVLLVAGACAQEPSSASNESAGLIIHPGDLLGISVYDNPDLTQQVRVEESGNVNLALIGSMKLSGINAQQAGNAISAEFTKRRLFDNAQVTVLIKEFATQGVSVTGEVQHAGVYPVLTARNVLDVLSMAGGLTNIADSRVTIKHRATGDSVTVRVRGDNATADLEQNAKVYPGDIVVVPRAGIVYVLGDVRSPGWFLMQDNGAINLGQALANAGGPNPTAAMNNAVLLRKNDAGYASQKVRVGDMIKGRSPLIALNANDILFIPGSKFKYMASDSKGIMSSVAGAAVYHGMP